MRLTVEEKQRDEGLILGRYSRIFIDSQMDEESFDFGGHIFWYGASYGKGRSAHPLDENILHTDRVMLGSQRVSHMVEKLLGRQFLCRCLNPRSAL